jgi:hypothetical protein
MECVCLSEKKMFGSCDMSVEDLSRWVVVHATVQHALKGNPQLPRFVVCTFTGAYYSYKSSVA